MSLTTEYRFEGVGHDYLWEEVRFNAAYPGINPDDVTMEEFYERLRLIPRLTRYLEGKDVKPEIDTKRLMDEAPWRIHFNGTVIREEDPDQLGL